MLTWLLPCVTLYVHGLSAYSILVIEDTKSNEIHNEVQMCFILVYYLVAFCSPSILSLKRVLKVMCLLKFFSCLVLQELRHGLFFLIIITYIYIIFVYINIQMQLLIYKSSYLISVMTTSQKEEWRFLGGFEERKEKGRRYIITF